MDPGTGAGALTQPCYALAHNGELWAVSCRLKHCEQGEVETPEVVQSQPVAKLPGTGRMDLSISSCGRVLAACWPVQKVYALFRNSSGGEAWEKVRRSAVLSKNFACHFLTRESRVDVKKQIGNGREGKGGRGTEEQVSKGTGSFPVHVCKCQMLKGTRVREVKKQAKHAEGGSRGKQKRKNRRGARGAGGIKRVGANDG